MALLLDLSSGSFRGELRDALISAYGSYDKLEMLVAYYLEDRTEEPLSHITPRGSELPVVGWRLVESARERGYGLELLLAALVEAGGNPALRERLSDALADGRVKAGDTSSRKTEHLLELTGKLLRRDTLPAEALALLERLHGRVANPPHENPELREDVFQAYAREAFARELGSRTPDELDSALKASRKALEVEPPDLLTVRACLERLLSRGTPRGAAALEAFLQALGKDLTTDTAVRKLFDTYLQHRGVSPDELAGLRRGPYVAAPTLPVVLPTPPGTNCEAGLSAECAGLERVLPTNSPRCLGREREIELLTQIWACKTQTVACVTGMGGEGKSTLIAEWLERLVASGCVEPGQIYSTSFHSQGGSVHSTSSDSFLVDALAFLDDPLPHTGTSWDKAQRLVRHLRSSSYILVLDALEPLQYSEEFRMGELRDKPMRFILTQLAASNAGLCIVTSRLQVTDLQPHANHGVRQLPLVGLEAADGASLLSTLGVVGTDAELQEASRDYRGHCLALTLLATYLVAARQGQIRNRTGIQLLKLRRPEARHAWSVLRAYEDWYAQQDHPALDLLQLLSLFDRPITQQFLLDLSEHRSIHRILNHLPYPGTDDWHLLVDSCERLRLVERFSHPQPSYQVHALVREYFASRLEQQTPETARALHAAIATELCAGVELPVTSIGEVIDLCRAVQHSCASGEHAYAWKIYWQQLQQERRFHSTRTFGTSGAELAALQPFYSQPFVSLAVEHPPEVQGRIHTEVGFHLRTIGRLRESIPPLREALRIRLASADYAEAAHNACHLSRVSYLLGDLPEAHRRATEGVRIATECGDNHAATVTYANLGDVLHALNRLPEAETAFQWSEHHQAIFQPQMPMLHLVRGLQYWDYLLHRGESDQVIRRCAIALQWAHQDELGLLAAAVCHLALCKSGLTTAANEQEEFTDGFQQDMSNMLQLVRESGDQELLIKALVIRMRASLLRGTSEVTIASACLDEADSLAGATGMALLQIDVDLTAAALYIANADRNAAQERIQRAMAEVQRTGFAIRQSEIEALLRNIPL